MTDDNNDDLPPFHGEIILDGVSADQIATVSPDGWASCRDSC